MLAGTMSAALRVNNNNLYKTCQNVRAGVMEMQEALADMFKEELRTRDPAWATEVWNRVQRRMEGKLTDAEVAKLNRDLGSEG
jgi:hypothetical protein